MKLLTGQRGVAILYAYMLLGLGFLRSVTPEFGDLASKEQQREGTFRLFMFFLLISLSFALEAFFPEICFIPTFDQGFNTWA